MSPGRQSLPSKNEVHLQHLLDSIHEIDHYLEGMDLAAYRGDHTTTLVVERLFQILTEAAICLGNDAEVLCPSIDWRAIRDLGNFLRHAYDHIDSAIIWNAAKYELPPLEVSVQKALAKLQGVDPA